MTSTVFLLPQAMFMLSNKPDYTNIFIEYPMAQCMDDVGIKAKNNF